MHEILKNLDWTHIVIALISLLGIGLYIGIQNHNKQSQKSGNNSKNFQANGDITVNGDINDK